MDVLTKYNFMSLNEVIEWNGYLIYRVSEKHIDSLIEISKSAFSIAPEKSYYLNKNATSEFGEPYLGFIAFDIHGEPAAFYGVYACQVIKNGVVVNVAQSGDTMTHKNHGGKGLFTKLASLTYELCKTYNIAFVFGFPNYNSYPGFVKKLNWICPDTLNEYRIKVSTVPLMKLAKKISLFNSFYSFYFKLVCKLYNSKLIEFKSSVLDKDVGGIHRPLSFVKYKSLVGGSKIISIAGVNVWVKADGFLLIGEIQYNENLDFSNVIKLIKRFAFFVGADVLLFQAVPKTILDELFSSSFTPDKAFPYGYCQLDTSIDPLQYKFVMADLDTF